jgi:hypothetical protein
MTLPHDQLPPEYLEFIDARVEGRVQTKPSHSIYSNLDKAFFTHPIEIGFCAKIEVLHSATAT